MINNTKQITCHIKEICNNLQISIYSVHKGTGVGYQQLLFFMRNEKFPNIKTALAIADYLGVSVDKLFSYEK